MKISFLVTFYNQEKYVRESIESILSIEKPYEWELLVGDDGSDDRTVEIINDYISQDIDHIHLYIMPRDKDKQYDSVKRASANRINLFEHSTGDCFCVLDGDDCYCDKKFAIEAIKVLEKKQDVSVVSYGYREFGIVDKECQLPDGMEGYIDTEQFVSCFYLPAGACVHRSKKESIEHIKKIGWFDDSNILMNSLSIGKMYYINRVIYAYRQTGVSLYSSMTSLEQAVLNVQSYDVDMWITKGQFDRALRKRYAGAILKLYYCRKHIQTRLGEKKKDCYYNNSQIIENSLSADLLDYYSLSNKKKKKTKAFISLIEKENPKYALKIRLNEILRLNI